MFSAWKNKQKEIEILIKKNQKEFRFETFGIFMQAPCGRLVVHQVLKDLGRQSEYKTLIKLQKPLLIRLKENCMPVKTTIYIKEEFR